MGPDVSPANHSRPVAAPFNSSPGSPFFALGVEEDGSTLRLRLTGELDWACVGRVDAALERACDTAPTQVVLDLEGLSFLDLAGLRAIVSAHERSQNQRFEVLVVRPRGLANRVFTLTRAGERLNMVDRFPA